MKTFVLLVAVVFPLVMNQSQVYSSPVGAIPKKVLWQEGKVKIKKDDLPESAKKTLSGDAFKGWSIVTIYKTKEGEYEVEMKKGDTTQGVKFDKDGKAK